MIEKRLNQKITFGVIMVLFSALVIVSAICVSAIPVTENSLIESQPVYDFVFEDPIDPLFSYPVTVAPPIDPSFTYPLEAVPPIAHIEPEDMQKLTEQHSHDEITCRVYNCPTHTNHAVEITCYVFNCPIHKN